MKRKRRTKRKYAVGGSVEDKITQNYLKLVQIGKETNEKLNTYRSSGVKKKGSEEIDHYDTEEPVKTTFQMGNFFFKADIHIEADVVKFTDIKHYDLSEEEYGPELNEIVDLIKKLSSSGNKEDGIESLSLTVLNPNRYGWLSSSFLQNTRNFLSKIHILTVDEVEEKATEVEQKATKVANAEQEFRAEQQKAVDRYNNLDETSRQKLKEENTQKRAAANRAYSNNKQRLRLSEEDGAWA
jgi:hypothetical protein